MVDSYCAAEVATLCPIPAWQGGEKRVLTFKTGDFGSETLYSRDTARAVVQAVSAFHQSVAQPVLLAPAGEPPAR